MPPPRGLTRLAQIALRSHHQKFIGDAARDIQRSASKMGLQLSGTIPLPTKKRKISLLRSPFVNSKSISQFQHDTHKRLIEVYGESTTGQDATNAVHFLRYLEHTILQVHPGCSARIKLFSEEMVDVGDKQRGLLPDDTR
jgi:small subunit ribosomal protein S10